MRSRVFAVSSPKGNQKSQFVINLKLPVKPTLILEYANPTTNENMTFGVIEIPQFSTIDDRKISVAIPKRLGIQSFEINSAMTRAKSDKNIVHEDYDMFHFRTMNKITNYYVFQTQSTNFNDLKSEAVILIS